MNILYTCIYHMCVLTINFSLLGYGPPSYTSQKNNEIMLLDLGTWYYYTVASSMFSRDNPYTWTKNVYFPVIGTDPLNRLIELISRSLMSRTATDSCICKLQHVKYEYLLIYVQYNVLVFVCRVYSAGKSPLTEYC